MSLARQLRHRAAPDLDGAEVLYRRAAAIGCVNCAWIELARFLEERGDMWGAESAYRNAVEHDEPEADAYLESFYREHPGLRAENAERAP